VVLTFGLAFSFSLQIFSLVEILAPDISSQLWPVHPNVSADSQPLIRSLDVRNGTVELLSPLKGASSTNLRQLPLHTILALSLLLGCFTTNSLFSTHTIRRDPSPKKAFLMYLKLIQFLC